MGETACKVPDAVEYIAKVEKAGRLGKKRKTAMCEGRFSRCDGDGAVRFRRRPDRQGGLLPKPSLTVGPPTGRSTIPKRALEPVMHSSAVVAIR